MPNVKGEYREAFKLLFKCCLEENRSLLFRNLSAEPVQVKN